MAARTFRKQKTTTKSCLFYVIFFFFLIFFLPEEELERVIENKGGEVRRKKNMEIQSSGEKMRNASAQQGAASKVKMSGSEKYREHEHRKGNHLRQFLPRNNV